MNSLNFCIRATLVSLTLLASTVIPPLATHAQQTVQSQLLQEKDIAISGTSGATLRQIPSTMNGELPPYAVLGGYENGVPLYLCSGVYQNGIHPGKTLKGNCNIGWGGKEIVLSSSKSVVITNPLRTLFQWVSSAQGIPLPKNPVATGSDNGIPLYVCRAPYNGGIHPGKVWVGYCNFGWGGKEIFSSHYEVLTVGGTSPH